MSAKGLYVRSSGSEEPVSLPSVRETPPPIDVEGPITKPTVGPVIGVLSSQDTIRGLLAVGFAALFGITIVVAFWLSGTPAWANATELLQPVRPAETAILGSTVGFYFGLKR